MIQPREYQSEALRKVLTAWKEGTTRQLISLPTGCGKTIIFGLVAEALRTRTLILAHREELLYQAEQKIRLVYPDAEIGILKASERGGLDCEICIASIQTAARNTDVLSTCGFKLLICDEAHHAVSESYMRVFEELGFMAADPEKLLLGVTATAFRGDKLGLDNVFEAITFESSILAMMKGGYLCDVRGLSVNTGSDISCVHMVNGDFAVNKLSALIDIPERNALIADTYLKHGEGRHGVVFGVKVDHAQHLAEAFRERGISCEAVYGEMPTEERQDILSRYARHEVRMLTNVGVLTEGWDVPDTDIIMMARPTKSRGLYVQCAGRGLRLSPGKKDCLLVDFVDIAKKHELCGFGTLAGKSLTCGRGESLLEEIERSEREQYARGFCLPPQEEKFDLFARSRYSWLAVGSNYKLSLLNGVALWCRHLDEGYSPVIVSAPGSMKELTEGLLPLDYCMGVCEDYARKLDGAKYALKTAEWRNYPATDRQIDTLRKNGVYFRPGISRGEACDLLGSIMNTGATDKQLWFIRRYRLHDSPELLTKSEASKLIKDYKSR